MGPTADVHVRIDMRTGKYTVVFSNYGHEGVGHTSYWKYLMEDGKIVQATVGNEKHAKKFDTREAAEDAGEAVMVKRFIPDKMKRMQFVDDVGHYTRRFTRIYVDHERENILYIGHTINSKRTKIEFKDLDSWVKYFDRI